MPRASAPSVPGRICRKSSAREASQVRRGSMTMAFVPLFMQSTTQCPYRPSEFETTGLLPQMTMRSGCSHCGLS